MKKTATNFAIKNATQALQKNSANMEKQEKKEKKPIATASNRARYSGYILPELWEDFTNINRKLSVTNNSSINLLIAQFVQQHKDLLEE